MTRGLRASNAGAAEPATDAAGLRLAGLAAARGGRQVLHGVDLTVPAGSYTCVLGASGSGKSTLLAAIAGTLKPAAGRITLDDAVLSDAATGIFLPPERRRLGMVFQDYLLWPHLTAADNVGLALRRREGADKARALAHDWLERVGLASLKDRRPAELSGGQQQRVALARALAVGPRLVLLDEPLSALDATIRAELRDLLRGLAAGLGFTALHVTHDAAEALALGHHLVVMSAGRVIQAGPADAVYARPATALAARLTGPAALLPVPVLGREGSRALIRLGAADLAVPADPAVAPGEATLVLRPASLSLRPGDGAVAAPSRMADARFLGDGWELDFEIPGAGRLSVRHDDRPDTGATLYIRQNRAWAIPRQAGEP